MKQMTHLLEDMRNKTKQQDFSLFFGGGGGYETKIEHFDCQRKFDVAVAVLKFENLNFFCSFHSLQLAGH